MNKIVKLLLSNNEEDQQIALQLLKMRKNRQLKQDLISIAAFTYNRYYGIEPKFDMYETAITYKYITDLIPGQMRSDLLLIREQRSSSSKYQKYWSNKGGLFYKKALEAHKRIMKQQ